MLSLPDGIKAMLQVCYDIVNVFCPNGQPNGVGLYILGCQFLWCKLAVGGGCRMNHKAFHVGNIGKKRKNLQAVNKPVRLFSPPFILKVKMEPPPWGKYF